MIKYIFVGVFFICFSEANASSMERKNLIEGCKQVVFLYENKNDQRRIYQFMTSASESLLAGYCKGLVQSFVTFSSVQAYPCEYNKKRYCEKVVCSKSDWYDVAYEISRNKDSSDWNDNGYYDVEDVLISGCR